MIREWRETGYTDFADGTFGNGGQNLYVSRKGILQRIFRFDLNKDGYADVVFANSHDMDERPPVLVYEDAAGQARLSELPTHGAYTGLLFDLNGDGFDDLIVVNQHNGSHSDIPAIIYYGTAEGLSERLKFELPVPSGRAVAAGDFDGDGLPDLAFGCEGKLKIFYQTELGFIPSEFVFIDLEVTHAAAADLDGDGYTDLYVRVKGGKPLVLWGGPDGLNAGRCTEIGGWDVLSRDIPSSTPGQMEFAEGWLPKIVCLNEAPHLFRADKERACLYPVGRNRAVDDPIVLECEHAIAAAAGDLNGDGVDDLVLISCRDRNAEEQSWIYWGTEAGFKNVHRTAFPTTSARDVAVADLNGDNVPEIAVCQGRTDIMYTTESVLFAMGPDGAGPKPVRFATHDATAVLIGKTSAHPLPQLLFINHMTGRVRGDVPVYAYLGGENGFSPDRRIEFPGWAAVDTICCDFNDDGWGDLLVANCSENAPHLDPGSFLYWGGLDGFHPDRKTVFPTLRAHGIAIGDFRHSGYLDVVFSGASNPELFIFRGGPGGFDLDNPQKIMMDGRLKHYESSKELKSYEDMDGLEYREPRWLLAADLNGDGWLDLVVSQVFGKYTYILWGSPDGFDWSRSQSLNNEGGICAQAADLNGNGYLDLIVGSFQSLGKKEKKESYVNIFWGGPHGYRSDRRTQLPAHTANSLTIADFNRDGIPDIFVTSYHSGRERDLDAYIYWGQPDGTYSAAHRTRLFTHSSCGSIACDFNEDGWVDLAVANHKTYGNHSGYSQIWWNGPEGFSEKRTTCLPTNGPHGMMAVDPGNIMDRAPEEFYVSSPHELPDQARVLTVRWIADLEPKTWVKAQLRFAVRCEDLPEAPWQGPASGLDWFENGTPAEELIPQGRWVQYRLALGAVNGGNSPRVSEVTVVYEVDRERGSGAG